MRKIDTKNKLKVFVLVAIIILMIGYTIVTATLIITKKNPVNYFNIKIADESQDTPSGNSNNNSNGNSNHYIQQIQVKTIITQMYQKTQDILMFIMYQVVHLQR